eukprot:TRINITY_DN12694_c0_g2_i1.p1 TRINITY_DN12694_c0_g2~~TRINITY_DN12694_c0_g2_i1.p1  ORF type:complete len:618 (+),score=154.90 TRINITY_DN12694_c0_g2_i1:32-1855(+)
MSDNDRVSKKNKEGLIDTNSDIKRLKKDQTGSEDEIDDRQLAAAMGVAQQSKRKRGGNKETVKRKQHENKKAELFHTFYEGIPAEFELKVTTQPPSVHDIQQLILWILNPEESTPRWVFVRNKGLVSHVNVICLNSFCLKYFDRYAKEEMPFLTSLRKQLVNTRMITHSKKMQKNSFMKEFFVCEERKKQRPQQQQAPAGSTAEAMQMLQKSQPSGGGFQQCRREPVEIPQSAASESYPKVLKHVASTEDLDEHGFSRNPAIFSFKRTIDRTPEHIDEKLFCIDCEMCLTSKGHELTRVCLIDWSGKKIIDELVVPENPIVDYLTKFSGITAEALKGVKTTLADIQHILINKYIAKDTVLIGHSLENDLAALQLFHDNICDTTVLFPHHQGLPYKASLRYLSTRYLGRQIQNSGNNGHDPQEDATAALDLVKLKICKGDTFGHPSKGKSTSMLRKIEGNCLAIDIPDNVKEIPSFKSKTDVIPVASDLDAVKKSCKAIRSGRYPFTFTHLHSLEDVLEACDWDEEQEDSETIIAVLRRFDEYLKTLYEAAPDHSAFIILSGQRNGIPQFSDVDDEDPVSSYQQHEDIQKAWNVNRNGIAILTVKPPK